jgi:hypothetical protein
LVWTSNIPELNGALSINHSAMQVFIQYMVALSLSPILTQTYSAALNVYLPARKQASVFRASVRAHRLRLEQKAMRASHTG